MRIADVDQRRPFAEPHSFEPARTDAPRTGSSRTIRRATLQYSDRIARRRRSNRRAHPADSRERSGGHVPPGRLPREADGRRTVDRDDTYATPPSTRPERAHVGRSPRPAPQRQREKASNGAISAAVAPRWSNRPSRAARKTAPDRRDQATADLVKRAAERAVTSRAEPDSRREQRTAGERQVQRCRCRRGERCPRLRRRRCSSLVSPSPRRSATAARIPTHSHSRPVARGGRSGPRRRTCSTRPPTVTGPFPRARRARAPERDDDDDEERGRDGPCVDERPLGLENGRVRVDRPRHETRAATRRVRGAHRPPDLAAGLVSTSLPISRTRRS